MTETVLGHIRGASMGQTRQPSRRHRQLVALLCLEGALNACAHHQPAPVVSPATPEETIAVYTAVIDDMYVLRRPGYRHPLQQLMVAESTAVLHGFEFNVILRDIAAFRSAMRHEMLGVPSEMLTAFLAVNARRARLPAFPVVDSLPVRLLSRAAVKQAFIPDSADVVKTFDQFMRDTLRGWAPFYRRYPGAQGLLVLSQVCFDRSHTWALVYAGNQFAGLGGSGYLIALQRVGQTWQLRSKMMLWQS